MCLILFAYQAHPEYRLIIAANRDEYYFRPTKEAVFWEDCPDVLAGRDLEEKGTWFGITKAGRFAAVTNYRDFRFTKADAQSRGGLVAGFLCGKGGPDEYLSEIAQRKDAYNGYNLLAGEKGSLYYYSNIERQLKKISPGIYGLSNHLLDTPWPKVTKGKRALGSYLQSERVGETAPLFQILFDKSTAPDKELPHTGVSFDRERLLSAMFVEMGTYGTRSSTVLLIDNSNRVCFVERNFFQEGEGYTEQRYEYNIFAD